MRNRMKDEPDPEPTFEVTVWNVTNGDIVKKAWEATSAELAEIEEQYGDEPFYEIQVEELP